MVAVAEAEAATLAVRPATAAVAAVGGVLTWGAAAAQHPMDQRGNIPAGVMRAAGPRDPPDTAAGAAAAAAGKDTGAVETVTGAGAAVVAAAGAMDAGWQRRRL